MNENGEELSKLGKILIFSHTRNSPENRVKNTATNLGGNDKLQYHS
jgi:hypothetical protein